MRVFRTLINRNKIKLVIYVIYIIVLETQSSFLCMSIDQCVLVNGKKDREGRRSNTPLLYFPSLRVGARVCCPSIRRSECTVLGSGAIRSDQHNANPTVNQSVSCEHKPHSLVSFFWAMAQCSMGNKSDQAVSRRQKGDGGEAVGLSGCQDTRPAPTADMIYNGQSPCLAFPATFLLPLLPLTFPLTLSILYPQFYPQHLYGSINRLCLTDLSTYCRHQ